MLTETQRALITDNRRLTTFVLRRYFGHLRRSPVYDYLRVASVRGLVTAAQRAHQPYYNSVLSRWLCSHPRTGKPVAFNTYACSMIWGYCKNAVKGHTRQPITSPFDSQPTLTDRNPTPPEACIASHRLADMRSLFRFLDPKDARILSLLYGFAGPPLTHLEIAGELGITKQRVTQRVSRSLAALRERAGRELQALRESL
jgi:RNA polymerase sigma factor (sigma-70 family)